MRRKWQWAWIGLIAFSAAELSAARILSWNVQNYLLSDRVVDRVWRSAYPKPEEEKRALREVLAGADADVVALQEVGGPAFLRELQLDLKAHGLDYPYAVAMEAEDAERQLAFLSRLPWLELREHRELPFTYLGEEARVRRGMLELVFESENGRRWHLFNLHLKSRYTGNPRDPDSAEQRNGEARAARDLLASRLEAAPDALLVVLGDLNDTRSSRTLRRFEEIGGRPLLQVLELADGRGDRWTYHHRREDVYSRVDYVILSPAAEAQVDASLARILESGNVRAASDHRPLLFELPGLPAPES